MAKSNKYLVKVSWKLLINKRQSKTVKAKALKDDLRNSRAINHIFRQQSISFGLLITQEDGKPYQRCMELQENCQETPQKIKKNNSRPNKD